MPAPNGQGFQLSVMPVVPQIDARLYNNAPGIISGINAGLGTYEQLHQISEDARTRPIRDELMQIKLRGARDAEAIPQIVPGDVSFEDATKHYPAAFDENGNSTGPGDVEYGDLTRVTNRRAVVNGKLVEIAPLRETIKTAEQQRILAESAAALNAQRSDSKFESVRLAGLYTNEIQAAEQARADGDEAAAAVHEQSAALHKARMDSINQRGIMGDGTVYKRKIEDAASVAGITLEQAKELVKTPEGAAKLAAMYQAGRRATTVPGALMNPGIEAMQGAPVNNIAVPAPQVPANDIAVPVDAAPVRAVDPAFSAITKQFMDTTVPVSGGPATATKPTPAPSLTPTEATSIIQQFMKEGAIPAAAPEGVKSQPVRFKTIEDATAAGKSGKIKKGQKIFIGDRPATWQ